ncbi:hypothetical protein EBR77_02640 [bacterium]|nr:hypothetical protein [bacterium]NBX78217.1 hypothetical protein [bacterium]
MNMKHLLFLFFLASTSSEMLPVHTGNTRSWLDWSAAAQKDPRMHNDTLAHFIKVALPMAIISTLVAQMIVPDLYTGLKILLFGNPRNHSPQIRVRNFGSQTDDDFDANTYVPSETNPNRIYPVSTPRKLDVPQKNIADAIHAEFAKHAERA